MSGGDPFMIRAHVPHWDASVADYRAASAAARSRLEGRLGVPYGPGADETLDLFFPERPGPGQAATPVHLFVHGGYWRAFSKEDFSFVAAAITAAGAIAAVLDYSLMPGARMATLVDQVRRAALWLRAEAPGWGGDPRAISASGHSAGAHLASYLVAHAPGEAPADRGIRSIACLSGLYDLAPLTTSFLQPELRFTPEEVERWSPIRAVSRPDATIVLAVGDRETAPFREQPRLFAAVLAGAGAVTRLVEVPDQDHMTIVREFGRPGTAAALLLGATIDASRSPRGGLRPWP